MLKNSTTITKENYYLCDDYISNSDLARFVSFDLFGNPIYNMFNFINKTSFTNEAMVIGTAVDEVLTEGVILEDKYGEKLDKAGYLELCALMGIDTNSKDTIASLQAKLQASGYKDDKVEMTRGNLETVRTILARAHKFQYDATRTFDDYISECQTQLILTDEVNKFRGKFDFYNPKDNRISDLKTTGNLEKLLKDIVYKGQVNVNHKYIRQLAFYQQLALTQLKTKPTCELIIIDHSGNHIVVRIGQHALDLAWAQIQRDLEVLKRMLTQKEYAMVLDVTNEEVIIDEIILEEDGEDDNNSYSDIV